MAATRSPNYPAISLPDAIELLGKVYGEAHTAPLEKVAVAKAMGYKSLNGASLTKISALDKYGLLARSGGEYQVSDDGVVILRGERQSTERQKALKRAATAPTIFTELYDKYGSRPPHEEAVRVYLETRRKFKPDAARKAAKSFHDTLQFVSGEGVQYDSPGDDDENLSEHQHGGVVAAVGVSGGTGAGVATGNELLRYRLDQECTVQVAFQGKVTQAAIEKLLSFLDLSKDAYPMKGNSQPESGDGDS